MVLRVISIRVAKVDQEQMLCSIPCISSLVSYLLLRKLTLWKSFSPVVRTHVVFLFNFPVGSNFSEKAEIIFVKVLRDSRSVCNLSPNIASPFLLIQI